MKTKSLIISIITMAVGLIALVLFLLPIFSINTSVTQPEIGNFLSDSTQGAMLNLNLISAYAISVLVATLLTLACGTFTACMSLTLSKTPLLLGFIDIAVLVFSTAVSISALAEIIIAINILGLGYTLGFAYPIITALYATALIAAIFTAVWHVKAEVKTLDSIAR